MSPCTFNLSNNYLVPESVNPCMSIPIWSCFICIGSVFNCVLPEALKITAVQHDPQYQPYKDSEKRRLRSSFSCLSSISSRQKQLSTSSLLLQSPLKGCLRPWELKKMGNRSLKERSWFYKLVLLPWNVCLYWSSVLSLLNSEFGGINVIELFWSLQMCSVRPCNCLYSVANPGKGIYVFWCTWYPVSLLRKMV